MMGTVVLSIVLLGEGLLTGITLTLMLGPVTMTILRYGLHVDRKAGVWAAAGTWVSDFVFIFFTYWMAHSLNALIHDPQTKMWIYIGGGAGLLGLGAMLAATKRKSPFVPKNVVAWSYAKAFASGFSVNSLSPFTLFFWVGAAVFLHLQKDPPVYYYLGVMLTLAVGDFFKAWLAPQLTRWIRERYVYLIQVIAGVVIALTGLYIIGMGIMEKM